MAYDQESENLRTALRRIAEIAGSAAGVGPAVPGLQAARGVCMPKSLPRALQMNAARTAVKVNPVNRPHTTHLAQIARQADLKAAIAVLTTKYWGPRFLRLTVSFLDNPASDVRSRILSHMNAWNRTANVEFVETSSGGQVRIARARDGYWSYLGTDILHIAADQPTMNLQEFTMSIPESEYRRVVRHETGHTLGFPHEHMRKELVALIDRQKAYDYFWKTQGWTPEEVDAQVLTSLDDADIMATPPDQTSIMCYQLPGEITTNGDPILGGVDINDTDYQFAGRIYPRDGAGAGVGAALGAGATGFDANLYVANPSI